MNNDTGTIAKIVFSILLFPTFFQEEFLAFAWAASDPLWAMSLKRVFLLLPVLTFILGAWVTIPTVLSIIFRHNRKEYTLSLFTTWWDLGKSIAYFWAGLANFFFYLVVYLLGMIKMLVLGVMAVLQTILLMPFRLLGSAGKKVTGSSIPLIAVFLTLFWVLIEATIFTYVTTPLVLDTLSNITGETIDITLMRIALFTFLFFIVLGSYAVLSTFVDSVKEKNISHIIGIAAIEVIVLLVEVLFLYREFVDALIPWFAMYAEDFQIGILGILAISTFVWFGIRSLSWFLFASYGTPTIMAIIQGKGIEGAKSKEPSEASKKLSAQIFDTDEYMNGIKENIDWVQQKGDELIEAFMLPPLQLVASAINFCTLLVAGKHMFDLPLTDMESLKKTGGVNTGNEKKAELSSDKAANAN
ncbi:MAG: hypothetical protein HUJ22_10830 [Gracilimonas sp.]|uniref:hypothetical protein n=1 Tax=Gracilimonas sp. TaxID=1974203 RepID=UPI00199D2731|nr:hypothetical protein [Gracilimonas sp.]MBD3617053.1 hypothetical protein [Gracilimonas sp.]